MRRASGVLMFVSIAAAVLLTTGVSFAQEEDLDVGEDYGYVVRAASDSITIETEDYDEDTGAEITEEQVYAVAPDVEIENAESLEQIREGQEVDIEYTMENSKKVATYIYVYKD